MGAAAVVAAPVIKAAAVGVAGHFLSKKLGKAPNLTAEGNTTRGQLFDVSKMMQTAGQAQIARGGALTDEGLAEYRRATPDMNAASGYLRTLVGGSRGAMTAALAPEMSAITSAYRGAESALDRGPARGALRDVASADIAREKAGKISGLAMSVRPQAVGMLSTLAQGRQQAGMGLAGLGQQAVGTGGNMISGSVSPLASIYQGELWRTGVQAQNQAAIGRFFASLMYDALKSQGGKSGNGGSGG